MNIHGITIEQQVVELHNVARVMESTPQRSAGIQLRNIADTLSDVAKEIRHEQMVTVVQKSK